jgi:cholesterol oxidase
MGEHMKIRTETRDQHCDVLVVGSGFGGSVTALRLTEKGYRVGVLEAGRRWADQDFAQSTWDVKPYMWAPRLGLKGIQRINLLPDAMVLAGAGVGGGSLVYSNVLYEPKSDAFYTDKQWAHITDWRQELAPHYDQAERMLGCAESPTSTVVDELTRKVAAEMGVERSLELTPVGVFFGREGRKEPGVDAEERILGMTGCRHGAKNTLVKNYLYLAESAGAAIHPESTVTTVRPLPGGRYRVIAGRTGAWRRRIDDRAFTADHVVISAGTWGTQQLLHRMKTDGVLPHLSGRLGLLSRTNSESIGSVTTKWRHRGITTSLRASRSHRHSNPTSTPSSKRSATEGA